MTARRCANVLAWGFPGVTGRHVVGEAFPASPARSLFSGGPGMVVECFRCPSSKLFLSHSLTSFDFWTQSLTSSQQPTCQEVRTITTGVFGVQQSAFRRTRAYLISLILCQEKHQFALASNRFLSFPISEREWADRAFLDERTHIHSHSNLVSLAQKRR